jgi:outer membrane immunogenic protein
MRKFLSGAATLIALASPAIAADLRLPVKAPPIAPSWSWTGCHVGGQVGALRASKKGWIVRTPGGAFFGESLGGHDADSWVAGVQAGCDYQFAGGFVIGLQGDYAWTDAVGRHDSAREFGVAYHSRAEALASVTGRIGYAFDRVLGYVRGGGAWERDAYQATTIILGTAFAARATQPGWTIGVGGEYAFTDFVSGFLEYSYYDFGTNRIAFTPQVAGLTPGFVDIRESTSVVRVGLNIRFGAFGVPVAGRY